MFPVEYGTKILYSCGFKIILCLKYKKISLMGLRCRRYCMFPTKLLDIGGSTSVVMLFIIKHNILAVLVYLILLANHYGNTLIIWTLMAQIKIRKENIKVTCKWCFILSFILLMTFNQSTFKVNFSVSKKSP